MVHCALWSPPPPLHCLPPLLGVHQRQEQEPRRPPSSQPNTTPDGSLLSDGGGVGGAAGNTRRSVRLGKKRRKPSWQHGDDDGDDSSAPQHRHGDAGHVNGGGDGDSPLVSLDNVSLGDEPPGAGKAVSSSGRSSGGSAGSGTQPTKRRGSRAKPPLSKAASTTAQTAGHGLSTWAR